MQQLLEEQGARPIGQILDVGAATGLSTLALLRAFPDAEVTGGPGWQKRPSPHCRCGLLQCLRSGAMGTVASLRHSAEPAPLDAGIDLSPHMLAVGSYLQRQRNEQRAASGQPPERLHFVHGAGEDTRLPSESFDLVSVMLVRCSNWIGVTVACSWHVCAGAMEMLHTLVGASLSLLLLLLAVTLTLLVRSLWRRCATSCLLPSARPSSRRHTGCCAPAVPWLSW